jgi:hypothetical protein
VGKGCAHETQDKVGDAEHYDQRGDRAEPAGLDHVVEDGGGHRQAEYGEEGGGDQRHQRGDLSHGPPGEAHRPREQQQA